MGDGGFVGGLPTRYISSFVVEFISDFMHFCIEQYKFSTDEVSIICVVATESTREILHDGYLLKTYGAEGPAIPDEFRFPVSVQFVCRRLGMPRETTRRKLESLANRGFLTKIKGGYSLPAQTDTADYTKELRDFLVLKVRGLQSYIEKIPR
ncbi:MAG: hypothetical protein RLZZ61_1559 [Pseudomonadota bacterium]|jgi:hypothetical protein